MDDQPTIQTELTRLAGSIGLELLTLGIVMLTNGDDFRRLGTPASERPLETGYSAIG
jgi:hypothetical protein